MQTHMQKVVNGQHYNTRTARIIASNEYWDGSSYERHGTNLHLYRTRSANYFMVYSTQWQGDRDWLEVLTLAQAKVQYEELPEEEVPYKKAFPGEIAVEA